MLSVPDEPAPQLPALTQADLVQRGLLLSDVLVQSLEEEADLALAERELQDAALCVETLNEIIREGPQPIVVKGETVGYTRAEQIAAMDQLRRWHTGSRSARHRRRLVKERDRGNTDASDKLLDRGRELLRDRRGTDA